MLIVASASQPSMADVLRAERELAAEIRALKKIGYPEFEKRDVGEQPVAIRMLRCRDSVCTYDVIVAGAKGRRAVHRLGTLFCQDPQDVWVRCVN